MTSKLSLAEYLKGRKPSGPSPSRRATPWFSSSEDDDSEHEDYEDNESERWDWDDESGNEESNGRGENFIPENGQSEFTYEEGEKAKLD